MAATRSSLLKTIKTEESLLCKKLGCYPGCKDLHYVLSLQESSSTTVLRYSCDCCNKNVSSYKC